MVRTYQLTTAVADVPARPFARTSATDRVDRSQKFETDGVFVGSRNGLFRTGRKTARKQKKKKKKKEKK